MGSGAFGRVIKAEAVALRKDEPVTIVAVKMIKNQNQMNTDALEDLVGEMKIMQYLESHVNVLNLLGACTKDISNGMMCMSLILFNNLQN